MGDADYDHKVSAAATGGLSYSKKLSRYQSRSRDSYSSRDSRETYSQETQVYYTYDCVCVGLGNMMYAYVYV